MKKPPCRYRGLKPIQKYPGYYTTKGGIVFGPQGKMAVYERYDKYASVGVQSKGKRIEIKLKGLIYDQYKDDRKQKTPIRCKDGNEFNCDIDNLSIFISTKVSTEIVPRKCKPRGSCKFTEEQVLEIRKLYASGKHTQRALGRMYCVSGVNINAIVRRRTWKHLP